jgi:hypothetical protein
MLLTQRMAENPESSSAINNDTLLKHIQGVLTRCQPFPGDDKPANLTRRPGESRFVSNDEKGALYAFTIECRGSKLTSMKPGPTGGSSPLASGLPRDVP